MSRPLSGYQRWRIRFLGALLQSWHACYPAGFCGTQRDSWASFSSSFSTYRVLLRHSISIKLIVAGRLEKKGSVMFGWSICTRQRQQNAINVCAAFFVSSGGDCKYTPLPRCQAVLPPLVLVCVRRYYILWEIRRAQDCIFPSCRRTFLRDFGFVPGQRIKFHSSRKFLD